MRQITEHTILAMPDAMKEIEARGRIIERQRAALKEVEEYFDDRADVDDGRPNDAMRMLVEVRSALTEVYEVHGEQQNADRA